MKTKRKAISDNDESALRGRGRPRKAKDVDYATELVSLCIQFVTTKLSRQHNKIAKILVLRLKKKSYENTVLLN